MGLLLVSPFPKLSFMEHCIPHNETFNISYRYCDERDYRLFACGIESLSKLRSLVSDLAGYAGIEDIRITYDTCYTDFKQFCL